MDESSHNKPKKANISHNVKKSLSKSDQADDVNKLEDEENSPEQQKDSLSGDTYKHSPSFSPSASTPHFGNGGFDNNFGNVSPISQSDSPADVVAKNVNKRSSVQAK